MAILGSNLGSDDNDGGPDPDKSPEDQRNVSEREGSPLRAGREAEETDSGGQEEAPPKAKSSFGQWAKFYPSVPSGKLYKPKVGYPCMNCEHTHMDHAYYDQKLCLIEGCKCVGLKMEVMSIGESLQLLPPKIPPDKPDNEGSD